MVRCLNISAIIFLAILSLGFVAVPTAHAQVPDCTGVANSSAGQANLLIDLTGAGACNNGAIGAEGILFNNNGGSNASIRVRSDGNFFVNVRITADGITTVLGNQGDFTLPNQNCTNGCLVQADYNDAPIGGAFNTTYFQRGGAGAIGAPPVAEIDVQRPAGTSIANGGTDAQGARTAGTPVTQTYTIANTGTATLNLTGTPTVANQSNVTVGAIGAPGTLAVAAGATTTFDVTYTPTAVGAFSFDLTVASDDADEANYRVSVQGTGTGSSIGTVTIIKNTSPAQAGDGTFTFASDAGGLNGLSLATSGNSATSAAIIVNAGAVAVTEDVIPGWKLSTIACTGDADSGSVVDVANRRVTIDVDANEAIVCTFTNVRDPDSVIRETQRVISNFMSERADVIVSNDPDLADRFRTGGSNGQGNPLGFAAQGDARDIELSFATSLRAMRRAANAGAKRTVEGIGADPGVETAARFDIWAQGTYARVDSIDRKSDVGLLHTGFDYRFSDNLLFGLLGQLDWTDQRERSTNTRTSADGVGWLIGPYLAARIHQNLILDGRAAWGQSYNNVNPLGLYEDDFNTNRWLVRGQLTGDFAWGNWTFNPSAGISYFSEKQKSYVDSLNITIPSQTITLGRAEAGPEVRYNLQTKDGWQFAPHVGVKGIWDFDPANIVTAQGVTIDSSGLRARAEGGTILVMPWGWSLNGTGFYDGIGAKDFQSYGGSVKVKVPLN